MQLGCVFFLSLSLSLAYWRKVEGITPRPFFFLYATHRFLSSKIFSFLSFGAFFFSFSGFIEYFSVLCEPPQSMTKKNSYQTTQRDLIVRKLCAALRTYSDGIRTGRLNAREIQQQPKKNNKFLLFWTFLFCIFFFCPFLCSWSVWFYFFFFSSVLPGCPPFSSLSSRYYQLPFHVAIREKWCWEHLVP